MIIKRSRKSERGNVFFTLFGAVAIVGVLGAGIMATMRGPLSTMVNVNRRTQAESQMQIASKLALLEAADQASDGDCESEAPTNMGDGFVEPVQWEDAAGAGPDGVAGSDGGGFIPANFGVSKQDPWGTPYGYCVWDPGTTINDVACGGPTQKRLTGNGQGGPAGQNYTVMAIISAGPDGVFQTGCVNYATADANADNDLDDPGDGELVAKSGGSDDVIFEYSYDDARGATGGLWKLKSGAPDTAEISKNLEVTGGATFTDGIDLSTSPTPLTLGAGSMTFPTQAELPNCTTGNNLLLRVNTGTTPPSLEICVDDGTPAFESVAAGAAGVGLWKNDGPGGASKIYYNAGQVGIGINNPDDALDVVGTAQLTDNLKMAAGKSVVWAAGADITENSGKIELDGVGAGTEVTVGGGSVTVLADTSITGTTDDGSTKALDVLASDASPLLTVLSDGKVGIGDAAPNDTLDVAGNVDSTGIFMIDGNAMLNGDNNVPGSVLLGKDAGAALDMASGGGAGDNNTILGAGAGATLTTGADNILIGYGIDTPSATTSEYLNLGDIVHADLRNKHLGIGFADKYDASLFNDALEVSGNIDATGTINATGNISSGADVTAGDDVIATGDVEGADLKASSEIFVGGEKLGPAEECGAAEKLEWDNASGWSCVTDLQGGAGGAGQNLEEVLTVGDDAGDLEAVNFKGIAIGGTTFSNGSGGGGQDLILDVAGATGSEYYCDENGLNCFTASTITAGNTRLDKVTAAAADNSINNADWNQAWNWQLTGAETGFLFGENAASTGGTNNQYILGASTMAASTAIPFYVQNLGNARSFQVDDATTDTTPFVIDASGNVGINAATPAYRLHVGNLAGWDGLLLEHTDGSDGTLRWTDDASYAARWFMMSTDSNYGLMFRTNSTPAMVVTNAQNVGIGDQSPDTGTGGQLKLDVEGGVGAMRYCDENGNNCFTSTSITSGTIQQNFTVTAGNIKPLSRFAIPEGTASFLIEVESRTSGHSGTKLYLFQGGYQQLGGTYPGNWYKMQPVSLGRGHGDSTNGFDLYVRAGLSATSYDFGVGANTNDKTLYVTFTDLSTGATRTDLSAGAEVAQSSAGDVYSMLSTNFQNTVGIGTTTISDGSGGGGQTLKLDVEGAVGATYYCDKDGLNCITTAQATTPKLNSIIAADNNSSINNAANNIAWNWQLTGSEAAFTFGENAASTGGSNDQYILKATTLASSTAIPLFVENKGAGNSFRVDDTLADTSPFIIAADGSVAIGTTTPTPSMALSVVGNTYSSGNIISGSGATVGTGAGFYAVASGPSANVGANMQNTDDTGYSGVNIYNHSGTLAASMQYGNANASAPQVANSMFLGTRIAAAPVIFVSGAGLNERMRITPTGEIGIGDTTPNSGTGGQLLLDVEGSIGGTQYCDQNGDNCFDYTDVMLGGAPALHTITAATGNNTINNAAWNQVWNWQLTGAETGFLFGENAASTGGSNNQYILGASTLASSTAMPFYVQNLGNGRSFQVDDSSGDTTPFVIDTNGNVGIGTASPGSLLTVDNSGITTTAADGIVLQNTTASTGAVTAQYSPALRFIGQGWKSNAATANQQTEWFIQNQSSASSTAPNNSLVFQPVRNGAAGSPIFFCQSNSGTVTGIFGLDGGGGSPSCDGGFGFTGIGGYGAGNTFAVYTNASAKIAFSMPGMSLANYYQLNWSSTNPSNTGGGDVGIVRNAAGVLEVNNTTSGQWGALKVGTRDAGTNTVTNGLTLGHQSTGTPAAGLGSGILFNINSSTTADQNAAQIASLWTDATHASRTSALTFSTVNNAGSLAEAVRISGAGNVGIGTSTPSSILHLRGTGPMLTLDNAGAVATIQNSSGAINVMVPAGGNGVQIMSPDFAAGPLFKLANNGQVGLNLRENSTYVPGHDLSFGGSTAKTIGLLRHPTAGSAGSSLTISSGGAVSGGTDKNGGNLVLSSGIATGDGSSSIVFQTVKPGQGAGTTDRSPVAAMTLASNALTMPSGPTTETPGQTGMQASVNGMIRYDSTLNKFRAYQNGVWQDILTSATGNQTALSSLTAAATDNSINNGDWNQVWNWQLTGAESALTLSENVASTGGNNDQYLLKLANLSGSTSTPLNVTNLGTKNSFEVYDVAADTSPFIIDNAGNVGIGIAAPTAPLHIESASAAIKLINSTNDATIFDSSGAGARQIIKLGDNGTINAVTGQLRLNGLGISTTANNTILSTWTTIQSNDITLTPAVLQNDIPSRTVFITGQTARTTATTNLVGGAVQIAGGPGSSASAGLAHGGSVLIDGGQGYGTGAAGNIIMGSVRGNVGIGTTTPDSLLSVKNGAFLQEYSNVNYYRNVAAYSANGAATGTMIITYPQNYGTNAHVNVTIRGYNYLANNNYGEWEVKVTGYDFGTAWHAYGSEISGNPPFEDIRLANDGTKKVILLGNTSTAWNFPSATITDVMVSRNSITGWGSGWGMTIAGAETGIVNIYNTVPIRNGQLYFTGVPSSVPISTDTTFTSFRQVNGSQYWRMGNVDGGGGIPTRYTYLQGGFTGSPLYYNLALNPLGGNVGIGTTSPESLLSVGSGGYAQFSKTSAGTPTGTDCDAAAEAGRVVWDSTNNLWYVCENPGGWAATTGAGSGTLALSSITAATTFNTIGSGDHAQTWNWTLTSAAKSGMTFGETAAATNGVGAQSVVRMNTLASSTAIPLWISNVGNALSFRVDDAAATDSSPFVVAADGKVGIGTASPTTKLYIDATDGSGPLSIKTAGVAGGYTPANSGVFFYDAAGTETLRIVATDPDIDNNYNAGNLFIGLQAGMNNETDNVDAGWQNTGIGGAALRDNTLGYRNTAIGARSLQRNTTGNNNIAIGAHSMSYNTTGSGNTGIGDGVFLDNTTGNWNTGIGSATLENNTVGSYNTAIGYWALAENKARSKNTAIGYLSMGNLTDTTTAGDGLNTAVGYLALYGSLTTANNTGINNTALGREAMYGNSTGSNNVAIGSTALDANTDGGNSVAIGFDALGVQTTGGTQNIGIGYAAGNNITTGDRNLIIGYDIDAPSATGDNQMSIGNLIFGTGLNGTGTTISSGKVGIADPTPDGTLLLDVEGQVGASQYCDQNGANCFVPSSGIGGATALNTITAATADNPGISNAAWNQVWNWQLTGAESAFTFGENAASTGGSNDQYILNAATLASSTAIPLHVHNLGNANSFEVFDAAADTTPFVVDASGNIGIGIAAPTAKLDIVGGGVKIEQGNNILFSGVASPSSIIWSDSNTSITNYSGSQGLQFSGYAGAGGGYFLFRSANNASPFTQLSFTTTDSGTNPVTGAAIKTFYNSRGANAVTADMTFMTSSAAANPTEKMRLTSGGNLGVGTTNPTARMHAVSDNIGNTSTDGFILENTTAATAGQQQWSPRVRLTGKGWRTTAATTSNTLDWIVENQTASGANSGVGSLVFSYQTSNVPGYNPKLSIIPDATTGAGTTIVINGDNPLLRIKGTAETVGLQIGSTAGSYRYIQSYESQPLVINSGGNNVGIGQSSPQSLLSVANTGYAQFEKTFAGAPTGTDCDAVNEAGRVTWDSTNNLWYVCETTGWQAASAAGSGTLALSSITAATADNPGISNGAWNQVWNWQLTGAESAFTFGENAASTGGSNDQYILNAATLASSTAIPLHVHNLGNANSFEVFDVAADTTPFIIDNAGQVGIGRAPTARLDVKESAANQTLATFEATVSGDFDVNLIKLASCARGSVNLVGGGGTWSYVLNDSCADADMQLKEGGMYGTTRMYFNGGTGGNTGIGAFVQATYEPQALLHLLKTDTAGNTALEALRISHTDTDSAGSDGIGGSIVFNFETETNATMAEAAKIESVFDDADNNSKDGSLRFYTMGPNATSGTTTSSERVRIASSGAVGINTTSPIDTLNVTGGARVGLAPTSAAALDGAITSGATSIVMYNTTNYPPSGTLLIEDEVVTYTSKDSTGFYGVTRGAFGTTAAGHADATPAYSYLLTAIGQSNVAPKFAVLGNGNVGVGTATPRSLLNVASSGYAQFEKSFAGSPTAADCNEAIETGRVTWDSTNNLWYVCEGVSGWQATTIAGGSSVALNSITAATAANTAINNADYAQTWNWTLTTAAKSGMTFGENANATNGAGAQSVVKMSTLLNSTAMPLWISNVGSANSFRVDDAATTDSTPFIIDASGNVAIGSTSASTKLQVGDKVSGDNFYTYDGDSVSIIHQTPTATATLNDPKTVLLLGRQGTVAQSYGAAAALNLSRWENNSTNSRTRLDFSLAHGAFDVMSNNVMTLLSSGNVGIGTSSPSKRITGALGTMAAGVSEGALLSGDATSNVGSLGLFMDLDNSTDNSYGYISMARTGGSAYVGMEIASDSRDGIRFMTGNNTGNGTATEYMRLTAGGNLGIGQTSPQSLLSIGNGGYAQFEKTSAGAPLTADCDAANEAGRVIFDTTNNLWYVCETTGWQATAGSNVGANVVTLTRTLPTTVNDEVDIGSFAFTSGGGALWVSVVVPSGGFSVSKEYLLPIAYNEASSWTIAQPIGDTGPYSNNYELDIQVLNGTASLRLRRTVGGTAGTAYVTIRHEGVLTDAFTASTATASVAAPTTFYGPTQIRQVDGAVGIGTAAPLSLLTVGSGGYAQFEKTFAGAPTGTDCDAAAEAGRVTWDTTNNYWYVCEGAGGWTATSAAASIGADTLDFTEFKDAMVLDASTDIEAPAGQSYVLSVTNKGSGNSFVVNDAASDTTPFVIDANGNVGIGITTPGSPLNVKYTNTSTANAAERTAYFDLTLSPSGAANGGSMARYASASSTTIPNTNAQAMKDVIGTLGSVENYGTGAITSLTGVSSWAYNVHASSSVGQLYGGWFGAETDGGTVTDVIGAKVWTGTYDTVNTNNYGLFIDQQMTGATITNRYGIYIDPPQGTATNDYGIYQGGSSSQKNYFASNVGIGTTSPTASLHIAGNKSASAWLLNGIGLQQTAATFTDSSTAASGTAATSAINSIGQSTLASTNASVTTTSAYGLYLAGAPISGTNQTVGTTYGMRIASTASVDGAGGTPTNAYGIWVDAPAGATNNYAGVFYGNVGFGNNANPVARVDIVGNSFDGTTYPFIARNQGGSVLFSIKSDGVTSMTSGTASDTVLTISSASASTQALKVVGYGVSQMTSDYFTVQGGSGGQRFVVGRDIGGTGVGNAQYIFNGGYQDNATAASGTATDWAFANFKQVNLTAANTGVTTTNAATVYIANAPAASTNQTITNPYALWIDNGNARFDGNVGIGQTSPQSLLSVGSGGYAQFEKTFAGAPTGTDCDAANEAGRVTFDTTNNYWYVCKGVSGWQATASSGGGVTADSLDFTEFKDAMALDASTDIAVDNAEVFSITNTGTANSFVVNDQASDTTAFYIDAGGDTYTGNNLYVKGGLLRVDPGAGSSAFLDLLSGCGGPWYRFQKGSAAAAPLEIGYDGGCSSPTMKFSFDGANARFGVGTNAPPGKFSAVRTAGVDAFTFIHDSVNASIVAIDDVGTIYGYTSGLANTAGGDLLLSSGYGRGTAAGGGIDFQTSPTGSAGSTLNYGVSKMYLTNAGNFSIGAGTTPTGKLDVAGTIRASGGPSTIATLNGAHNNSVTTITVNSTTGYPTSGALIIANSSNNGVEVMTYTGTTSTTFTGVTRGVYGTSAAAHDTATSAYFISYMGSGALANLGHVYLQDRGTFAPIFRSNTSSNVFEIARADNPALTQVTMGNLGGYQPGVTVASGAGLLFSGSTTRSDAGFLRQASGIIRTMSCDGGDGSGGGDTIVGMGGDCTASNVENFADLWTRQLIATRTSAAGNAESEVMRLVHTDVDSAASNNIGAALTFVMETATSGTNREAGRISAVFDTATDASKASSLRFYTMSGAGSTTTERMRLTSNGTLQLLGSTSGSVGFVAPATAAGTYILPAADGTGGYQLTTDGAGNLSWAAAGGGGGSIDGLSDAYTEYSTNHNIIMGRAGASAMHGSATNNLIIGELAATGTSTAATDHNTAVGYAAIRDLTGGYQNTAMGSLALAANTSGALNTAIGYVAMTATITGSQNTAVGAEAAYLNKGNFNSAFGQGTLYNNDTGEANTAIGQSAMYQNTVGEYNTALGRYSMYSNKVKSGNTAVGAYANIRANDATSGPGAYTYNTAVGYQALAGSATAANNTGIYNTAVGSNSLLSYTTGSNNSAFGSSALYTNSTGGSNVAMGAASLQSSTTGSNNTAVGQAALNLNTTGASNTAVGHAALSSSTDGDYNTAVGDGTLGSVTTGGTRNLGLGAYAGFNITTGDKNIVIGYNIDAPSATADGQLNIGNLLFGTGINGTGTTLSTGNIGIGVASPGNKLTVENTGSNVVTSRITHTGTAGAPGTALQVSNGYAAASGNYEIFGVYGNAYGSNYLSVRDNGNLGVGQASPQSLLTVGSSGYAQFEKTSAGAPSATAPTDCDAANEIGRVVFDTTNDRWYVCKGTSGWINTSSGGGGSDLDALADVKVDRAIDANMFIGTDATSPGANFDFGAQYNTFMGIDAGKGAVATDNTADSNTGIGFSALSKVTTGEQNTAVGTLALYNSTTADQNVAIGSGALFSNTTGNSNMALGQNALYYNTIGTSNVAMGQGALLSNVDDNSNTAVGNSSQAFADGGSYNTTIGASAGYGVYGTTNAGWRNTLIGAEAGNIFTTADGNTAIGYRSAQTLSTGNYNIMLGMKAGDAITTGSNNIVIGYDIDPANGAGNNQMTIGNLIFATGLGATGTTVSTGKVGIGVNNPTYSFEVKPSGGTAAQTMLVQDATASTGRTKVVIKAGADASPGDIFDIQDFGGTSKVRIDGSNGYAIYMGSVAQYGGTTLSAYNGYQIQWGSGGGLGSYDTGIARNAAGVVEINNATAGTYRDLIAREHFSSLSSTAGNAVLEGLRISHTDSNSAGSDGIGASISFSLESETDGTMIEGARIEAVMDDANNNSKDSSIRFYNMGLDSGSGVTAPIERWRIDNLGRLMMIGSNTIGSTSPDAQINFGDSNRTGGTGGLNAYYGSGYYTTPAHEFFGGTAPNMVSVVRVTSSNAAKPALIVKAAASQTANLTEWHNSSNTALSVVDASGQMGIGTATPGAKLDVNGTSNFTGTLSQSGGYAYLGSYNAGGGPTRPRAGADMAVAWNYGAGTRDVSLWNTDTANTTGKSFIFRQLTGASSHTDLVTFQADGKVGIGITAPSVALDVSGDIEYTGTITDVSDRRLKTDINPLDKDDVIERLNKINTYSFRMKDDKKGQLEMGVMAQEMKDIFPELVRTADDEMGTMSVNYVGLIAPLVEASKDLKAQNDNLKTEIETLKKDRTEVQASIEDLAKQVELLNKAAGNNVGKASIDTWYILGILLTILSFSGIAFFAGQRLMIKKSK